VPYKYYTLTTGPTQHASDWNALQRCLAGVWNGTDGVIRIHQVRARMPSQGCSAANLNLGASAMATGPNGTLQMYRCTAYSGGTAVTAVKHDTDDSDPSVQFVVLPDTCTTSSMLRAVEAGRLVSYSTAATLPLTVYNILGGRLSSGNSYASAYESASGSTDATPIVMKQDQGLSFSADQDFGYSSMPTIVAATVVVGSATYSFTAEVVPNYLGVPHFVIFNTGATDAKLISLYLYPPTSFSLPTGNVQNNSLRLTTLHRPDVYTAITPVSHDTADAVPSGLLTFKNAVASAAYSMDETESQMIDFVDITVAAATGAYVLAHRFGRIGALRVHAPDRYNRNVGFFPEVEGQLLWSNKSPPIVVPIATGFGVNMSSMQDITSTTVQHNLLNLVSSLDVEIVLSYEAPAAAPSGGGDVAFFG